MMNFHKNMTMVLLLSAWAALAVAETTPAGLAEFFDDLQTLSAGPMTDQELERLRKIGDHIHRK